MSLKLEQIIINKRSGVIHTRNCESVTQMHEGNKKLSKATNIADIEKTQPCGHCIKKRDLRKLYAEDYERRKQLIEKRRARDHKEIDEKYDDRLEKLEMTYRENLQGLKD